MPCGVNRVYCPRTVRAVVVRDFGERPTLTDVSVDDPCPGEVVVAVAASGICGSDIHALHGNSPVAVLPMIMGHEGSGVVAAVGQGVDNVAPGDHVVIGLYGPCFSCESCRHGRFVHCTGQARLNAIRGVMGDGTGRIHGGDTVMFPYVGIGSLAELVVVRESQVVGVPDDLPIDVLALAGCGVTTGLGAVFNIARVTPGERVLVVGCGGVGLNVIQGASLAGASTIVAADPNPVRLALASDFGATHPIDPSATDLAAEVSRICPAGVDAAFEVVGDPALVAQAFTLTRGGGRCVMVGAPPPGSTIPIPAASLMMGERQLLGCLGGSSAPHRDIPRIVELYRRRRIKLDELVGERVPLTEFQRAIDDTERGAVARALVTMSGADR